MTEATTAEAFVAASRAHLLEEYIPKIRRCLDELDDEGVWWRPNPASNAVGNLVLHLCGNATQWILHGVLGEPDVRRRDAEFAASAGEKPSARLSVAANDLGRGFDQLVAACSADAEFLAGRRTIQGMDVSVLEAVYHVVEHFAQHTGQIIYITKLRTAGDLGFWEVQDGVAKPNW